MARLWASLLIGIVLALGVLGLWGARAFSQLDLRLSDLYFVPSSVRGDVVIVALDDPSFARFGRSPAEWSRTVYADLVRTLSDSGARVVAFDLLFSEPSPDDEAFAEALREARQSESRTRIVMASAGIQAPTRPQNTPFLNGISYQSSLVPVEVIANVADYQGLVNAFPDIDSRVRRQISVGQVGDDVVLSFSLATYLAYLRVPAMAMEQVVLPLPNALQVTNERQLPVDENGLWRQNYFGEPLTAQKTTFSTFSLVDVLDGEVDTQVFQNKVVLVGVANSTGSVDQYLVPSSQSGQLMAGVEIQANALETLLQNVFVYTLPYPLEGLLLALSTLGATLIYTYGSVRWKLFVVVVVSIGGLVLALALFSVTRQLYPIFYFLVAITLPLPITVAWELNREFRLRVESEAQKRVLEATNQRIEEEKRYLEVIHEKETVEIETLQALNKLKTHMIRMASHDLKNPLGRVVGYSELMLMKSLPSDQERFIKSILKASEEMNTLITDILNLEQLRSAQTTQGNLSLNKLVNEIVIRHEPEFEQKEQAFEANITPETLTVYGDLLQLSQAISNLIGNASKYTPNGGKISVRLARDETPHNARFEIKDTGYGIPERAIENLFTEFYRVKMVETSSIAGSGLGLSLVKTVVTSHGGQVWVESKEGEGSTFFVLLPLAQTKDDL